ncbi:MAG: hypothetical protein IH855_02030 [Bacteroidetes bacterium]|nr:hypothetical protein [Bacteroidota bacterium]
MKTQSSSVEELVSEAVSNLNNKNLRDLWLTNCLLSLVEYFGSTEGRFNPLFPFLNQQLVSLLGDAILRSDAMVEKHGVLSSVDVAPVLNPLVRAADLSILDQSISDPTEQVLRMIQIMGTSQIRFDAGDLYARMGRSYAMLAVLPELHREQLKKSHGSKFVDLPKAFEESHRISVRAYYQCALAVFAWYKTRLDDLRLLESVETLLQGMSPDSREGSQTYQGVFRALVNQSKVLLPSLAIGLGTPLHPDDLLTEEVYDRFFRLASRTTEDLRIELAGDAAQAGYFGHQISPLEMYPIVKLEGTGSPIEYVIPDFRKYNVGITQIPHFAMMRNYPDNRYNQVLGSIQELYIEDLVLDRLSEVTTIPERVYGREHKRGPDLTIIDRMADGLICVESKAKRMRTVTKVDPMSEELLADTSSSLDALRKQPKKIEALYAGLSEYEDHQASLDATKDNDPVCVIIMGEGVFSFSHVLDELISREPDHFLHSFPYPYCLMSIDIFERAVEIAAQNRLSLYELLRDYWQVSKDPNPKQHAAEEFGGLEFNTRQSYPAAYIDKILAG